MITEEPSRSKTKYNICTEQEVCGTSGLYDLKRRVNNLRVLSHLCLFPQEGEKEKKKVRKEEKKAPAGAASVLIWRRKRRRGEKKNLLT